MSEAVTYLCGKYRIEKNAGKYEIYTKAGELTLQPPFNTLGEARLVIRELMEPIDQTMRTV